MDEKDQTNSEVLADGIGSGPVGSSKTLEDLVGWYDAYVEATHSERESASECRDFYDGIQWSSEEVAELELRGQPIVTANRIAPKIDFLIGGEIASRIDPVALPRTPNEDGSVSCITDTLRYAAGKDYADYDSIRTEVMESLCIEGVGGALLEPEGERKADGTWDFTLRPIPYNRLFWDPYSRDVMFGDASYRGVVSWLDFDMAQQKYGVDRVGEWPGSNSSRGSLAHEDAPPDSWYDRDRRRIKVCEIYWEESGVWWLAHYRYGAMLSDPIALPYLDDQDEPKPWCPLVMVRFKTTREKNEHYGVVRALISLQQMVNKHRSKSMHLLQSDKTIAEEGVFKNPTEAKTELARPGAFVEVEAGSLVENRVLFRDNFQLAASQMQLCQEAKSEIDQCGPSAPVLAESATAMSGIAVLRKKELANTELRPLYDKLTRWQHEIFCRMWWWIRQYWSAERWVRVTDDETRQGYRFVAINQRMTRAQRVEQLVGDGLGLEQALSMTIPEQYEVAQLLQGAQQQAMMMVMQQLASQGIDPAQLPPEMQQAAQQQVESVIPQLVMRSPLLQTEFIANQIAQIGVDILIETTPDIAIVQQEQFEMLADMAGKGFFNPQMTPWPIMRLMLQSSQLRDKRKLIEELEKTMAPAPDPQQQQAAQQQVAMQLQAMQAQLAKVLAEVDHTRAETAKTIAEIPNAEASAQLTQAQAIAKTIEAGKESVPTMNPAQQASGTQRNLRQ